MTINLFTQVSNAMVDARTQFLTSGKIEIRTGAQPTGSDPAASGTILATFVLDATPVGAAVNRSGALADTPLSVNASATGEAGHYRVYDSAGNPCWDGACATSGSEMTLGTLSLVSGVAVTITVGSFTQPAS